MRTKGSLIISLKGVRKEEIISCILQGQDKHTYEVIKLITVLYMTEISSSEKRKISEIKLFVFSPSLNEFDE